MTFCKKYWLGFCQLFNLIKMIHVIYRTLYNLWFQKFCWTKSPLLRNDLASTFKSFQKYFLKTLKQWYWPWKHMQKKAVVQYHLENVFRMPLVTCTFKGTPAWEFLGSDSLLFYGYLFKMISFTNNFVYFAIIREGTNSTIIPRKLSIHRTKDFLPAR